MIGIIKIILAKFWPVLIPFFIYLAGLFFVKIMKKKGKKLPFDGNLKWLLYLMFVVCFASFYFLMKNMDTVTESYVPTKIEAGKIVPSRTVPR